MTAVKSEDAPAYEAQTLKPATEDEDQIVQRALMILRDRLAKPGVAMESPGAVKAYLNLSIAALVREKFCVMFLDNRHRLLSFEALFEGTIDGCSVHPREVVRRALELNSAAVFLAHNHPSGVAEPSRADITITRRLTDALALIDVRVLDHFVIGHDELVSFAERGLL